jgi:signal transduction histidine kinase
VRLGIKGKQVFGVTSIVGAMVVILSLLHLAQLARVSFKESEKRAEMLAKAVFHRAREVVTADANPYEALRADRGLRSLLESALYSENVTFAAIVDTRNVAVVHDDPTFEGQVLPAEPDLTKQLEQPALSLLVSLYRGQGRNIEYRQPLLLGNTEFGSIRIGVSTLLIREELDSSLGNAVATALAALAVSVLVATLLAQLLLRPIHVIRSGLKRLERGEFGVRLDLNQDDEFGDLGTFFNAVSAQLSADRSQMAGQVANLESAVEHLEDAVAIVSPRGELLFANPAMRLLLPDASPGAALDDLIPAEHPLRRLAEQTLVSRQSRGPLSATFDAGERLMMTHAVNDASGQLVGVMLVARNLEYFSQVQSTIRYSRKLAALGRLSAGVAHEVKNPLNAMMIHLELLKQQIASRARGSAAAPAAARQEATDRRVLGTLVADNLDPSIDADQALQHVDVIATEIKRLDEVVQGFLKFTRPDDLKLQPVALTPLIDEVLRIVRAEADRTGVELMVECDHAPDVNGDPAMLRQAFLNLALNACQAMPNGGTLRITGEAARGRQVKISFADTGVGIAPEHLKRIFDLYFTTREKGSGIGLSMVYRIIQMHDGEIEVQSTPGAGTTFTILLPQA